MGSRHREPRPKSPERIRLKSIDSVRFDEHDGYVDDAVTVQATFTYYTWCCHDAHEMCDAVEALHEAIEQSTNRAERKRNKKAKAENDELLKEFRESGQIQ